MTVLKHPVVVIAGPTASGKSGLALDLAEALNGVVINADSMQIYQDERRIYPDRQVPASYLQYFSTV